LVLVKITGRESDQDLKALAIEMLEALGLRWPAPARGLSLTLRAGGWPAGLSVAVRSSPLVSFPGQSYSIRYGLSILLRTIPVLSDPFTSEPVGPVRSKPFPSKPFTSKPMAPFLSDAFLSCPSPVLSDPIPICYPPLITGPAPGFPRMGISGRPFPRTEPFTCRG
jgi:hypothetical protein